MLSAPSSTRAGNVLNQSLAVLLFSDGCPVDTPAVDGGHAACRTGVRVISFIVVKFVIVQ